MGHQDYAIDGDEELASAARAKTSYDSHELPGKYNDGQLGQLIQDAKRYMETKTGSSSWYSDMALGQALVCLLSLKMKESVENVSVSSYGIGDEQVSFSDTDPETSQQIVSWSNEMNEMLNESGVELSNRTDRGLSNTGSYIG